jgi:hypothetical protein
LLSLIDLSENSISYINGMLFKNLPNLRTIELQNNKISSLSSNAFSDILTNDNIYIDLSNNRIKIMSKNTFLNTNKLYQLDLTKNYLKVIPDFTMFSGRTNLRNLIYAENKFIRGCRSTTNPACFNEMKTKIAGIVGTPVAGFTLTT